ncbi:MAG TPA: HTH domain-containing protein [Pirellulaceae bacterium]|jgi:DeoR/GlpR family transcriptional regulator of sugar metabolism|nr:HTH domain-containing protein [Pirellulaceae bacterium]
MPNQTTPRQRQILALIGQSSERLSIRALEEKLGVTNPISIQRDLTELNRLGLISSDRRLKRRPR